MYTFVFFDCVQFVFSNVMMNKIEILHRSKASLDKNDFCYGD